MWTKLCENGETPHKFEARYSLGASPVIPGQFMSLFGSDVADIVKAAAPKTYIYDICVKCGKTINKAK